MKQPLRGKRQLDAFAAFENIRKRTARMLAGEVGIAPKSLLAAELERWACAPGGLLSELIIETALPHPEDATLEELAEEGALHRKTVELLDASGAFPRGRRLWRHQADALRASSSLRQEPSGGGVVVVSSGTGSGKTECFMIPLLDRLIREADAGRLDAGVRAIILYPLNALVMDQIGRWRRILRRQEAVLGGHLLRIGLYTSRLAEDERESRRTERLREELFAQLDLEERERAAPLDRRAEVRHRRQLREDPPHVLITNYSMMEYALVRPKDDPIFYHSNGKLQAVVLDEAHTYRAGMAAEIAMLIRRVCVRFGVRPEGLEGFATSATFGATGEMSLARFAADIFGRTDTERVRVIVGQPLALAHALQPESGALTAGWIGERVADAHEALDRWSGADDDPGVEQLKRTLSRLDLRTDGSMGSLEAHIHDQLSRCAEMHRVASILEAGALAPLRQLAAAIAGTGPDLAPRAAELVLRLASLARSPAAPRPLLPLRVHGMLEGLSGISICCNGACPGRPDPHPVSSVLGHLAFTRRVSCEHCGSPALELWCCRSCRLLLLAGPVHWDRRLDEEQLCAGDVQAAPAQPDGPRALVIVPQALPVLQPGWIDRGRIGFDAHGTIVEGSLQRLDQEAEAMLSPPRSSCPRCSQRDMGPVRLSAQSLRLAAMESLVEDLPGGEGEHPSLGRRLLSFSDGRQAAARLAPLFAFHRGVQLFRAALSALLEGQGKSPEATRLTQVAQDLRSAGDVTLATLLEERAAAQPTVPKTLVASQLPEVLRQVNTTLAVELCACDRSNSASATVIARPDVEEQLRLLRVHVSRELSRRPTRFHTAESLGLVELRYPAVDRVDASRCGTLAQLTGLDVARTRELLSAVLDTVRRQGAVAPLDGVDEREPDFGGAVLGKWMAREGRADFDDAADDLEESDEGLAFVPTQIARSARAELIRRLLETRRGSVDDIAVREVLQHAFDCLCQAGQRVGGGVAVETFRGAPRLQVRLGECEVRQPQRLWHCSSCGTRTSREIGICGRQGCRGTLERIYRAEDGRRLADALAWDYAVSRALEPQQCGARCVEHTAQLEASELELLEVNFRRGHINLLSSSTTLELGIDIGELAAVVLNGLPPAPANYLQRAGRAGRRNAGTSLVLTVGRGDPADRWAFNDLLAFLGQPGAVPRVHLGTERISRRHLNAWLLSSFFTSAGMRRPGGPLKAWGKVGSFVLEPLAQAELERACEALGLRQRTGGSTPVDLCRSWLDSLRDGPLPAHLAGELKLLTSGTLFDRALDEVLADLTSKLASELERIAVESRAQRAALLSKRADADRDERYRFERYLGYRLEDLGRGEIVTALSREGVLPRYGFPLDIMRLDVRNEAVSGGRGRPWIDGQRYRMERAGAMGVREYAPGNELVLDGFVYKVDGISRTDPRTLEERPPRALDLSVCLSCSRVDRDHGERSPVRCPRCDSTSLSLERAIVPQGFATDPLVKPRRAGRRPDAMRSVSFFQDVSAQEPAEPWMQIFPTVQLRYVPKLSLWALARGRADRGFYVCLDCGRADPADPHRPEPPATHKPLAPRGKRGRQSLKPCKGRMNRYWIAHGHQTDGFELSFAASTLARVRPGAESALATSLAQTLRVAAASQLEVDIRELEQIHWHLPAGELRIVIFDQRPGGSGYLPLLCDRPAATRLLEKARRIAAHEGLSGSGSAKSCHRACPACLLTLDARLIAHEIDRNLVVDTLSIVLPERSTGDRLRPGAAET